MEKKFNPLVSIVIPVYNGSNYLKEAIDSAISQSYNNIEILVINDGSNDNGETERIAKSYGDKIRYFEKENGGVASALNYGIREMRGKYFSWLSHDDKYTSEKIYNQIYFLSNLKDKKSLITSNYCYIDNNGNFLYNGVYSKDFSNPDYGIKLLFNFVVNGCSILIHKSFFEKYGNFNENLPTTQDYDMWFRILKDNKLYFLDKIDVLSRTHEDQGSKKAVKNHIEECDNLWINIINSVDDDLKIKIYGSVLSFFEIVYDFLTTYTLYDKAILFIRQKIIFEITKMTDTEKNEYFQNKFSISYSDKLLYNNSNKKRVVFGAFGKWSDKGGLNRVVANIANELNKHYDIFILASGNKKEGYLLDEEINYVNVENMSFSETKYPELITMLLSLINSDIYVSLYNCSSMYLNILDKVNKTKIKTIVWNHEYYFLPYANKNYYKICEKRNKIFSQSDVVLWLTKTSNYIYNQIFNNSIVMHNALTIETKGEKFKKNKKNIIVTAARFDDRRKNLEGVIYIAFELKKIRNDFEIYVLGNYDLDMLTEDNSKSLNDLINELNVRENLIFKGFISDIEKIYAESKINLLTSYHEGFGLTIIEAAQYSIPTIAFNDSGFEDMIFNEKNGFLFDRSDYNSVALKIDKVFNNDSLLKKISLEAYASSNKFSKEKIVNDWKVLLENLLCDNINVYISEKQLSDLILNDDHKKTILKNSCLEYENSIKKIIGYYEEEIIQINKSYLYNNLENSDNSLKNETIKIDKKNIETIQKPNLKEIYRKLPIGFRRKVKKIMGR